MKYCLLHESPGERRFALIFQNGDDVFAEFEKFFAQERIVGAQFSGIGAFARARLGFYDLNERRYDPIVVDQQAEVVSFMGDVGLLDGNPVLHAHALLGLRGGETIGGHFLEGTVRPTLEVVLTAWPVRLQKRLDPEIGLALFDLDS